MPIIHAYHGTNQEIEQFTVGHSRVKNDFYGGGAAYFTESLIVARQYAKAATKRAGGNEIVYRAQLNLKKIFDVDEEYTGKPLKDLIKHINTEEFARGAGLMSIGVDRYTVMSSLKEGTALLTGTQVFRGLSRGMINTAKARDTLIRAKYDSLRYNGGLNMGAAIKHHVYIVYDPRDIRITGIYGRETEETQKDAA